MDAEQIRGQVGHETFHGSAQTERVSAPFDRDPKQTQIRYEQPGSQAYSQRQGRTRQGTTIIAGRQQSQEGPRVPHWLDGRYHFGQDQRELQSAVRRQGQIHSQEADRRRGQVQTLQDQVQIARTQQGALHRDPRRKDL